MASTRQKIARLNPAAKKKLEQIQSLNPDQSQADLLDHAIDLLEREMFLKQVESDFAYIASNKDALRKYNEASAVFDGATSNGPPQEVTVSPAHPIQEVKPPNCRRGDIWMVDFGNPLGTELGMEHPAVLISVHALNNSGSGRVIVVPGTSTHITNAQGRTIAVHQEVPSSSSNGLHHTTYFMSEQVRTVALIRFRRLVGAMENAHIGQIEDCLCLVMGLFR